MKLGLSDTERAILGTLLRGGQGEAPRRTLSEIARAVGITPPAVLRHLQKMTECGIVARSKRGRSDSPHYRARPFFQGLWIDPQAGRVHDWSSRAAFPIDHPLVSRVPDLAAQEALLHLFRTARRQGLLPVVAESGDTPAGLAFAVIGSCARGDARTDSDVDLAVLGRVSKHVRARWADLAIDSTAQGGRRIQIGFLEPGATDDTVLRQAVREEGILVHVEPEATTSPESTFTRLLENQ